MSSLITGLQIKFTRYSFRDVPNHKFDPIKLRESLKPILRRQEMARRMGISETYLFDLEKTNPFAKWPEIRKKDFLREVELWKKNPDLKPRKKWGRKHGCRADGSPVPSKDRPRPVPHSHHEIVGIG